MTVGADEQIWTDEMLASALSEWARRLRLFCARQGEEPIPNYVLLELASNALRAHTASSTRETARADRHRTDATALTVDDRELIDCVYCGFPEREHTPLCPVDFTYRRDPLPEQIALNQAASERDKLELRVRTFLAKLDECAPHIDSAFLMMEMHGGPYRGPDYAVELAELKASLAAKGEK